jgi:uncharacterized RDD family membrane protein YckC
VSDDSRNPDAGLLRRLAAGVYDGLLVLALLFVPTSIVMAFRGGAAIPPGSAWFQLLLLATVASFFIGFWVQGGQTLGMRAWRLRVERRTGEPLSYRDGLVRFAVAIVSIAALGLGFLWMVFDPQGLTWHDRVAGTRVVVMPKR